MPYTWLMLVVAGAAAHPQNLRGVPREGQAVMRAGGGYREGIFAGQKLTCARGEGFVVWNANRVGGTACSRGRCDSGGRGDYPLTVEAGEGVGVAAVCAGPYGVLQAWGSAGLADGQEFDLYARDAPDLLGSIGVHSTDRPHGAVALFWSGAAVAFAGVAAHAAAAVAPEGTRGALLQSHYIAMPLAILLLTAGAVRASGGAASGTTHGTAGAAALAYLWLVAAAGSVHKFMGKRKKWLAQAHRVAGYMGIVLIGGMAWFSRDPLERAGATDAAARASMQGGIAFFALVLTVLLAGVAYSYRRRMEAWPPDTRGMRRTLGL